MAVKMNSTDSPWLLSLYIYGINLKEDILTSCLGVESSRFLERDKNKTTSTGKTITQKISVWELRSLSRSFDLSKHIEELADKLSSRSQSILGSPGVDEAHIDIFMTPNLNKCNLAACDFELTRLDILALEKFSVPVRFSISFVEDKKKEA
jgi:hypothetical protein